MSSGKHPLETYLAELGEIHATGAGTKETSYYPALGNLLSEVGRHLKPRVRCVMGLKNLGAGMPDGGLFTADQFRRGSPEPVAPQSPARGVIEVKAVGFDLSKLVSGEQVARYWAQHRLVLVTDYRECVLAACSSSAEGCGGAGRAFRRFPQAHFAARSAAFRSIRRELPRMPRQRLCLAWEFLAFAFTRTSDLQLQS